MNPLALLTDSSLAFKCLAVLLVALALLGYGFKEGNDHGTAKLDKYVGAQAVQSLRIITLQGAVTERVVVEYRDRVVKGATVTKTITNEVTKYVEGKPLTLACMLDNRWVRLHDAAAAGSLPPPADGTDGATGGVTAAGALPTITDNYARANRDIAKLKALQSWNDGQSKVRP